MQYIAKDHIVYLTWKKFSSYEDNRELTLFASKLLKTHDGANFVIDARNGFEDEKDDVEWGFRILHYENESVNFFYLPCTMCCISKHKKL